MFEKYVVRKHIPFPPEVGRIKSLGDPDIVLACGLIMAEQPLT
jgi:hypothetical protein